MYVVRVGRSLGDHITKTTRQEEQQFHVQRKIKSNPPRIDPHSYTMAAVFVLQVGTLAVLPPSHLQQQPDLKSTAEGEPCAACLLWCCGMYATSGACPRTNKQGKTATWDWVRLVPSGMHPTRWYAGTAGQVISSSWGMIHARSSSSSSVDDEHVIVAAVELRLRLV